MTVDPQQALHRAGSALGCKVPNNILVAVLADQAVDLLAAVLGGVERLLDPSGQHEVAAAPRLCKKERVH